MNVFSVLFSSLFYFNFSFTFGLSPLVLCTYLPNLFRCYYPLLFVLFIPPSFSFYFLFSPLLFLPFCAFSFSFFRFFLLLSPFFPLFLSFAVVILSIPSSCLLYSLYSPYTKFCRNIFIVHKRKCTYV